MQTDTKPQNLTILDPEPDTPTPDAIRRLLGKRSFATLATTSAAGRPHAAGVLYELIGDVLWINTLGTSRKVRNVRATPHVGVSVPVRRLPVGPPSSVQFQATAAVVGIDDPEVRQLLAGGQLKSLTSHGELDLPDSCFLRIALPGRILTHGLGMSLRKLIADPIAAGRTVMFEA